ncbi:hypothetical protein PGT21_031385 [Puccinia graminis f. sp. tritici]|uniref:Uncharacterized protein n=1 Tax=Puccinia graminis f. sp. tritici TaxID=56615 RepID=A0A5B0QV19_PUCGR|nr:hypothetical protein PGT21_031385 [Puccinia graminis f. sp. tritici]KAA1116783.1 hypothetical protein PGTUg99_019763 [Puccinia graminis f. sp. tritici]KAA1127583.1 hypothetical protein PGTUg99_002786 [Puccinia graminis f. sp. tritici]
MDLALNTPCHDARMGEAETSVTFTTSKCLDQLFIAGQKEFRKQQRKRVIATKQPEFV